MRKGRTVIHIAAWMLVVCYAGGLIASARMWKMEMAKRNGSVAGTVCTRVFRVNRYCLEYEYVVQRKKYIQHSCPTMPEVMDELNNDTSKVFYDIKHPEISELDADPSESSLGEVVVADVVFFVWCAIIASIGYYIYNKKNREVCSVGICYSSFMGWVGWLIVSMYGVSMIVNKDDMLTKDLLLMLIIIPVVAILIWLYTTCRKSVVMSIILNIVSIVARACVMLFAGLALVFNAVTLAYALCECVIMYYNYKNS